MIKITENIEELKYNYKAWYKAMNTLIGEKFDTTIVFENSLSIGHKIHIDSEHPILPNGMTISATSTIISLDKLRTKTLEVLNINQEGNSKTINVGIRSTTISD